MNCNQTSLMLTTKINVKTVQMKACTWHKKILNDCIYQGILSNEWSVFNLETISTMDSNKN